MNTTVQVTGAAVDLRPWFDQVEGLLSRFRPDSALSQLNRGGGRWTVVPPLLFKAVSMAVRAAAFTQGAFDPTVLDAMEAAGYGQSYELGPTPVGAPVPACRWTEIKLEPSLNAVWLPVGVRLDLGGLGKGMAVDGALALMPPETESACVNAGGDIGIRTRAGAQPVLVDVADPFNIENTRVSFALHRGGVATSSTLGRHWGKGLHHIIDPVAGRPAESGIVAATVVAESTARAEVLAKSCIVLGEERGLALLDRQGCPGILITDAGKMITTPGMEAHFDAGV